MLPDMLMSLLMFPPESEWVSDVPSEVPVMARFSQAFCSHDVDMDAVSRPARIVGYPDELFNQFSMCLIRCAR